MENKTDIIIIGAGIAGLFAARELSKQGKHVCVIEARQSTGGRIRTATGNFSKTMDAGPEFIHGDLPITKGLLKEAGITFHEHEGKFYRSKHGKISVSEDMTEGWDRVMKALKSLKQDTTLADFLHKQFGDEKDTELRNEVTRLAEGFDAADANRISAFAVREEWSGDSIDESYLIEGGYSPLIAYITAECQRNGCTFHLGTEVQLIRWKHGQAVIECSNGQTYEAAKTLITVSLGVLTAAEKEKCSIRFLPPITEKTAAATSMGFGPVIKINAEFKTTFWDDQNMKGKTAQIPDFGFLNSDNEIPVWWTKTPDEPFLIGWVGGSKAEKLKGYSDEELFAKGITSLAAAMLTSEEFIKENLVAHSVSNWATDDFTKGAYSYETPETVTAKKVLAEPLEATVFFAGEALGDHMGTVESAMESAVHALEKMRF